MPAVKLAAAVSAVIEAILVVFRGLALLGQCLHLGQKVKWCNQYGNRL